MKAHHQWISTLVSIINLILTAGLIIYLYHCQQPIIP